MPTFGNLLLVVFGEALPCSGAALGILLLEAVIGGFLLDCSYGAAVTVKPS